MLWLFRALTDRLKAMFVADVATDFEAQLLARDAERQAELLRQAQKYELGTARPLASVLPAIEHWQATEKCLFLEEDEPTVALLPAPAPAVSPATVSLPNQPPTKNKKKGR
jgi:hypothetical protein